MSKARTQVLAPNYSDAEWALRVELAACYRDMATRLPASETPARALKILSEDAAQPSPSP